MSAIDTQRNQLRRTLRQRRGALLPAERRRLSRLIAQRAAQWLRGRSAVRVALFLSLPDEVDTAALIRRLEAVGHTLYVPRIQSFRRRELRFVRAIGPLRRNRYGIPEPYDHGRRVRATELDVVFVPLVGFDRRGARLGMGAGFYDRAFAFRQRRSHWRKPLLVGLAFSCLEVERIPEHSHDVRLDAIVTEHGVVIPPGAFA